MGETIPMSNEDIMSINGRKKDISDRCSSYIRDNAETILVHISGRSQPNGLFAELYKSIEDGNRRAFPKPEQAVLLQIANGYAVGLIERLEEGLYMNSDNPFFVEFVKKQGRLPNLGELHEGCSSDIR